MTRLAMLALFGLSTLMIGCDSTTATSNNTPVAAPTEPTAPPKANAKAAAPAAPASTKLQP
jgi:predicted component of type VI protein secretion system